MNTLLPRTLFAAAAVLASSTVANAAGTAPNLAYTQPTAAAPVRVDRVQLPRFTETEFNHLPQYISISFTNVASQPATDVVLGMLDKKGNVISQYDDAGTFSPGVTIVAQAAYDRIIDKVSSAEVEAVTFADGSTWTKTESLSRRQSAF